MPGARKSLVLLTFLLLLATTLMLAGDKKSKSKGQAQSSSNAAAQMDEDKKILHALNRFTFGPTPGEVDQVRAMGLDKWFELQLHPDRIDDSALDARLAPFRTLKMSPRELVMNFPPPQLIRQIENGRMGVPSDPAKKAIYESRLAQ